MFEREISEPDLAELGHLERIDQAFLGSSLQFAFQFVLVLYCNLQTLKTELYMSVKERSDSRTVRYLPYPWRPSGPGDDAGEKAMSKTLPPFQTKSFWWSGLYLLKTLVPAQTEANCHFSDWIIPSTKDYFLQTCLFSLLLL